MAINRLFLWLGQCLAIIAVFMAITALSGLLFQDVSLAILFAVLSIVIGLLGSIFIFATRNIPAKETKTDALAFLLVFWVVIPLFVAIPFRLSGAAPTITIAFFEAVSAITTTGASTLDADNLARTLHIWRSLIQWAGGVVVATFAVVILAALNLKGTGIHRSMLFTFKKGELFSRISGIGKAIAGVYGVISFTTFVFLVVSGTPVFEAFCLSLTSVSTGGLMPSEGMLNSYVNPIGIFALCMACLLGAFNVSILWDFVRIRTGQNLFAIIRNVEHRTLLGIIAFLFLLGVLYTDLGQLGTLLPEAVFFATTTGYDYHVIGLEMVPPIILIMFALVGGSALSTAGGVKLIRILLLFRHFETDLSRLTHPSRVVPVRFRGQIIPDEAFLSIWMYFFGYTFVFAMGILSLSAVGMTFPTAVTASAATLSNMGPLLDYTLPVAGYESFSNSQLFITCVLMLIGRVEVLAFLSILSPKMWKN